MNKIDLIKENEILHLQIVQLKKEKTIALDALEKIVQSKDCNCADVGVILNCIDCPDAFHNIAKQALERIGE